MKTMLQRRVELCIDTKRMLGRLLAFSGDSEDRIETLRQKLCKIQAFEPYATFQRIDRKGRGYLTFKDI